MNPPTPSSTVFSRTLRIGLAVLGGTFLVLVAVLTMHSTAQQVRAAPQAMPEAAPQDPIEPPEGHPKFTNSTKMVEPALVTEGGELLTYTIDIVNTGAYSAEGTILTDELPDGVSYVSGTATVSDEDASPPVVQNGVLTWTGDVGFDESVRIQFQVEVSETFSGLISNTAVISHPLIAEPVEVVAEAAVSDDPRFVIAKTASPDVPGANQELTYTIRVTNVGQPTPNDLELTVTDTVPVSTTYVSGGSEADGVVSWNPTVSLGTGESAVFSYVVQIDDVLSGTVITNDSYGVTSTVGGAVGEPHTITVLDPILHIVKEVSPDPMGSNRQATYTITVLNRGAMATDLVVTDTVPVSTTYASGGTHDPVNNEVSWTIDQLGTNESAHVTYTVDIGDIANVEIVNRDYRVCSAEQICTSGQMITSTVLPADLRATAEFDPIAKKPGAGDGVTTTLTLENLGPGNATGLTSTLRFTRVNVALGDIAITASPGAPIGTLTAGGDCGEHCFEYHWEGDLLHGHMITFTAPNQNTIGGQEGTTYTATINVSDSLDNVASEPISATAVGQVTHFSNLIPTKAAPAVIDEGGEMTYSITVRNSAMAVEDTGNPVILTDTVPADVTVVEISDGGQIVGTNVVSWTLPELGTGETLQVSYRVRIDEGLISGTQIVNDDYAVRWYEDDEGGQVVAGYNSNAGEAVTTTVVHRGLIDSYKVVTPVMAESGPSTVLTYAVHIVNSSSIDVTDVRMVDILPWENTTYLRDAVASSGTVISDIVSVEWTGDVAAFSEEIVTFTVQVDPYFEGVVENTAVIQHADLISDVVVSASSYVASGARLQFHKMASSDAAYVGEPLEYTIHVQNLGSPAASVVVTDRIPTNATYVEGSASDGGTLAGNEVRWEIDELDTGETLMLTFSVNVGDADQIVNRNYAIRASGGRLVFGEPVVTPIHVSELSISKSASADVVEVGDELVYTITVTNVGDPAANVVVTDTIPANATYVEGSASDGGMLDGDQVGWNIATLGVSQTIELTFSVVVSEADEIVNDDYGVDAAGSDVVLGDPVTTAVEAAIADLTISKVASADAVSPGDELEYTITVVNNGDALTDVVVTDAIPANTTYVEGSASDGGTLDGDQVRWDVATLGAGETIELTFSVVVGNAEGIEEIVNDDYTVTSAEGTSADGDPVTTAVEAATVDLTISKVASADVVNPGDELEYTITVVNNGDALTDLVVADAIPANTTYVEGSASDGGTLDGDQVRWDVATLGAGETIELTFSVVVGNAEGIEEIVNDDYTVNAVETGPVSGDPVVTPVEPNILYLPILPRY